MTEQLAHKQMSEQLKLADAVQRVSSYAEEVVGAPAETASREQESGLYNFDSYRLRQLFMWPWLIRCMSNHSK